MHTPRNDHERVLFDKLQVHVRHLSARARRVRRRGAARARDAARRDADACSTRARATRQILAFEIGKYGEEALRIPLDTGYRRLVWVLPVAALLGAAGVLVTVARRSSAKQRAPSARRPTRRPTVGPDDEYQSRLDDELDELD